MDVSPNDSRDGYTTSWGKWLLSKVGNRRVLQSRDRNVSSLHKRSSGCWHPETQALAEK